MRPIEKGALPLFIVLFLVTVTGRIGEHGTDRSSSIFSMDTLYAQEHVKSDQVPRDNEQKPENAATLYQVMAVILVIWLGLALFLFRLDRKVTRLEKQTKNME